MSTLFERLTIRHFFRGWSVFWRMNLPFWIGILHAALAVGVMVVLQSFQPVSDLIERVPGPNRHPLLTTCAGSLLFFILLWPVVRPIQRGVAARVESDFWRSQFMIMQTLGRVSRGLSIFLVASVWLVVARWEAVLTSSLSLRVLTMFFVMVLGAVLALIISLHGWLIAQWKELEESRVPGD